MSDITEKASSFVDDLGAAARRNPISAVLIGIGIASLFASGKSARRIGDVLRNVGLERVPRGAKEALDTAAVGKGANSGALREAASSSFDALRARSEDAVSQVAEYSRTLPDPGELVDTARDNLMELFKAQPLALGVVGLAIGAGIAAALPNTDVEDTYLGEASETVRSKTAELAGHQVENATTLASNVMEAAAEEARRQGLTMEDAKVAAGRVAVKVSRVAEAAHNGRPSKPVDHSNPHQN
jgi:hypothetical protein